MVLSETRIATTGQSMFSSDLTALNSGDLQNSRHGVGFLVNHHAVEILEFKPVNERIAVAWFRNKKVKKF